ncbi:MAG TPA: hypothetical protein VLB73_04765 [Patescibacteria group bacterium]|nr:hypothetical protein [Patescibacteria group bacterium]
MPEASAEHTPSPEVPKTSGTLMLAIANGEFDISKTPGLNKTPDHIAQKTFDILKTRHNEVRKTQQEQFYELFKQNFAKDSNSLGEPPPDLLKHIHFVEWSKRTTRHLSILLDDARKNDPDLLKTQLDALKLLGLPVDDDVDPSTFHEYFYQTTSNTTGHPGTFYTNFCTGNTSEKLIETLSESEIISLKPFIADLLGSSAAYDALLATKQTDDLVKAKQTIPTSPLQQSEQSIIAFFQGTRESAQQNVPVEQTEPQSLAQQQPAEPTIATVIGGIAGGFAENIGQKAKEYAGRIEAALAHKSTEDVQQLLRDYEATSGLPYHPLYNIDSPTWLSPKLADVPVDQQLQRITDILSHFNAASQQESTAPIDVEHAHFSLNPLSLTSIFGLSGLDVEKVTKEIPNERSPFPQMITERHLSRQVTPEDLQKINEKLQQVGWHAIGLEVSGDDMRLNLERNPQT